MRSAVVRSLVGLLCVVGAASIATPVQADDRLYIGPEGSKVMGLRIEGKRLKAVVVDLKWVAWRKGYCFDGRRVGKTRTWRGEFLWESAEDRTPVQGYRFKLKRQPNKFEPRQLRVTAARAGVGTIYFFRPATAQEVAQAISAVGASVDLPSMLNGRCM